MRPATNYSVWRMLSGNGLLLVSVLLGSELALSKALSEAARKTDFILGIESHYRGTGWHPDDEAMTVPSGLAPVDHLRSVDQPDLTRRAQAGRARVAPEIDGNLDDAIWNQIPAHVFRNLRPFEDWVTLVRRHRRPPMLGGLSSVRMAYDNEFLYLGFVCALLYGEGERWEASDDGIDIFLQPGEGDPVFEIRVRADGSTHGPSGVESVVRVAPGGFAVEAAVPFASLGVETPEPGDRWRANFGRTESPSGERTAWSYTGDYSDKERFGLIEYTENPRELITAYGHVDTDSGSQRDLVDVPSDVTGRIYRGFFGYPPDERILIEAPSGLFLSDENGRFAVSGLLPGTTTIRAGSVRHRPVTVEFDLGDRDAALPPLETSLRSRAELDAILGEAARAPFFFGERFEFSPVHHDYQACPSIAVAADGTLLATYTAFGDGENVFNAVIVDSSTDAGRTWKREFALKPGFYRGAWGNLWRDPRDRIWMVYQHFEPGKPPLRYTVAENWEPGAENWSQPQILNEDLGPVSMYINKPLILSDGTWMAPVESEERVTPKVQLVVSADEGATWKIRGEAPIREDLRSFAEPMVVEREDGSLWMLIRTSEEMGGLAESESRDGGRTWSEFEPSDIPHTSSRFYLGRLDSGRLLLVKHNPDMDTFWLRGDEVRSFWRNRSHLTAYLSDDDGESWYGGLLIDERLVVSYPDVDQDDDGRIYIIYDHGGRHGEGVEIVMAVVREEDIAAGDLVSEDAELKRRVSRSGPAKELR